MITRRSLISSASCALICPGRASWAGDDALPAVKRGDFGPFTRSLNIRDYGYSVIDDPTGQAPTPQVERFELRSGDCHFSGAWSDCEKDRERSELSERGDRNPRGTSAWYGWWFYVPPDWPDLFPTKTVLGQFHQDRSHPLWMFLNYDGGLVLDDQAKGRTTRRIPLIHKKDFAGKWHRIELHANWQVDKTGLLSLWVNGKRKFAHQGPTMTAQTVYFKYGVYRSFISRYQAASGQDALPTQIALFAKVRRSKTREGLL